MSMKTRDEKEKKRDLFTTIFWILVLVFLIVKIVIPETGVLGMVNEGSYAEEMTSGRNIRWKFLRMSIMS